MLLRNYPANYRAWLGVGAALTGCGLVCVGLSRFAGAEFGTGFLDGLGFGLLVGSAFVSLRGLALYRRYGG